jgi:hypothetical protein
MDDKEFEQLLQYVIARARKQRNGICIVLGYNIDTGALEWDAVDLNGPVHAHEIVREALHLLDSIKAYRP